MNRFTSTQQGALERRGGAPGETQRQASALKPGRPTPHWA